MPQGHAAGRRVATGSRLRVAVVQAGGVLGGAERWQLNLADATGRLEIDVIAIGAGPAALEWEARGWPVTTVPNERRATRLPRVAALVGAQLRRSLPDVVVAHGVKAGLVTAPAARALGVPFAWVRHDASFSGRLTDLLDRVSDGQVATSSWLFEGRRTANPLVLNPPRMGAPESRESARSRLALDVPEGRLVLGMAARITHGKGIDDAIRALAQPAAQRWNLAVAGIQDPAEPGEQERLVTLAAGLGVADRVHFLGEVSRFSGVVSAFDAVAVLTKPTETLPWHREAFGMSALEAITAGVPVVATPPVDALVADGGCAVRPGAPGEVAAVLASLEDDAVRSRLGAAGTRRSADYPDAEEAAGRLVDFLAELAHRPGVGIAVSRPPISVVTTVLNDERATKELLSALLPQLGVADELIVVDGGSSDGTTDLVNRCAELDPRVRLIVEDGAGISRGRNLGIGAADNDAIACTDAGCIPVPGWVDAMRRAFHQHPAVDLWTGTYRVEAHQPWEHALVAVGYPAIEELARPTPLVRLYGRFLGRSFDASMPTGRSVAFRRAAWARAGGFPEDLQTGEDVLFGRRIVAGGSRARMVRDAEVSWAQRPSLRANLRMLRRYGEGSGNSLDARLLGRDVARAIAYASVVGVALRGGPASRTATAAGAAAYLSLPMSRAVRGPSPVRAAALVPPLAAARDLAKAYGALSAALRRSRTRGWTR